MQLLVFVIQVLLVYQYPNSQTKHERASSPPPPPPSTHKDKPPAPPSPFEIHYPRADGAKRRARVLIPPAIYTRGNESIKSKVHQSSRALTNDGWSSSLISKIWLVACRSGISKISSFKRHIFGKSFHIQQA